jgi:signal transduction histidine kinase
MQKTIYLAKSLLVLSYSLLFLLLGFILPANVWEPLFQAVFVISFIVLMGFTYEPLYSAFLQALGSSRIDSALRRIGGVAEFVDNLHEYTDLDALLRYTQSSLVALLGGGNAKILLAKNYLEIDDSADGDFILWGSQHSQTVSANSAVLRYALNAQQGFRIEESPQEVVKELQRFDVDFAIPIFCRAKMQALLLVSDSTGVLAELQTLLAFFARQFGIALERIVNEGARRARQEQSFAEKSAALATLSATIAHEMRTPLSGVRASIGGVDSYLPDLIAAYQFSHEQDAERFPAIRNDLIEVLTDTGPRIKSMVDQANHVIDLLLVNLNDQRRDATHFTACSVRECVEEAIAQYPFRRFEREKVHVKIDVEFKFLGDRSLLVYVLFNLLKNALYSLESAGRGAIHIDVESGEHRNYLFFEDTGLGIEEDVLPLIFDGFFTTSNNGTGAGLAFCRRTMRSFGGDIRVNSVPDKFARFTLEFPHI